MSIEITISCKVRSQDVAIKNGGHIASITQEPSEGKDCVQSLLSYSQPKPGSILVTYSWKVPPFIKNLESQSVYQARKILNTREGERLTLLQSLYLRRRASTDLPGSKTTKWNNSLCQRRNWALQLTQDSVASNIKSTTVLALKWITI